MREIKERTYYTLRDRIVTKPNLHKASIEVIKNGGSAGIDNISIPEFNKNYKTYMRELYREFKEDRYTSKPVLRVFIPKGDGVSVIMNCIIHVQ